MLADFWRGKKVLIVGHTGFKGTWLTYWLCMLGAEVTGYSLDPVEGSCFDDLQFNGLVDIRGDVLDVAALEQAVVQAQPEILFFLATPTFVPESILEPLKTYNVNVIGLVNILESVRAISSVKATLVVTSDKVYSGDCPQGGFKEASAIFGAIDPYSSSKTCQELVVETYRNVFLHKCGLATARASNVLGGGDPVASRLIPSIIKAICNEECVEIRNPLFVRPWQNILDCLTGYLKLAQCLYEDGINYSGAWNIGPDPGITMTVEEITKSLCRLWGCTAKYEITSKGTTIPEKDILRLNIDKAKRELNFSPLWSLEQTLEQIVCFYKSKNLGQPLQETFRTLTEAHMSKVDEHEQGIKG